MEPIQSNAWRCISPVSPPPSRMVLNVEVLLDQASCARCGSANDMHPIDICLVCPHMVRKHGENTDGCGHIGAAGWCECVLTFDRPDAEFVKW